MVQWWQIVVTVVCIILSGTFSGLTLGLMSLDIIDLRVLTESGTEREKWYARRILPVRKHGNWLLCTLLIGNTAVNSALAIVTADLFGGIPGFLTSTITILYVGEIIPQAVCHRFGLVIGAHAIPFVKMIMFLTAPLSFTTAKILNCALGGEPATRYNKSQLKSLLSIHGRENSDMAELGTHRISSSGDLDAENRVPVVALGEISTLPAVVQTDDITRQNSSSVSISARTQRPSRPRSVAKDLSRNQQTSDARLEKTSDRCSRESKAEGRFHSFKLHRRGDRAQRKGRKKKEREKESVSSNPPLTRDEMTMLDGAFDFSQKTVAQVMTSLDDVFMLEASVSLNFEVLLLIFQSGHSRIPVYDRTRDNIIGVLFAKDLILLDPEDSVPIKTVLLFFNRTVLLVFFDTALNKMLNIFRQGGGHMAIVQQPISEENSGPVPATVGIVTLEDLIEELIGQDIVDETDVYTDNISKQRVKRVRSIDPEILKMFDSKHNEELLSAKEVLVVASYLANNTREFAPHIIRTELLRDMLAEVPIVEYNDDDTQTIRANAHGIGALAGVANSDVLESAAGAYEHANAPERMQQLLEDAEDMYTHSLGHASTGMQVADGGDAHEDITIYTRGVPSKKACLIINGRLEICAGSDGFLSEAGPWTLLGVRALTDDLYAPDFTARVTERPTRLLRISRKLYRVMVQYSATKRVMVADQARSTSGDAGDARHLERNRSASSLALAASAAAVAVGSRRESGVVAPTLRGLASDASVVRRSRQRQNGQSIEWSEMEPLAGVEEMGVDIVKPSVG